MDTNLKKQVFGVSWGNNLEVTVKKGVYVAEYQKVNRAKKNPFLIDHLTGILHKNL